MLVSVCNLKIVTDAFYPFVKTPFSSKVYIVSFSVH